MATLALQPAQQTTHVATYSQERVDKLPLERTWALWASGGSHNKPARQQGRQAKGADSYTAPQLLGSFNTVGMMWRHMNNVSPPSRLGQDLGIYIFQKGIPPTWECPDNRQGGRWTFAVDNADGETADRAWQVVYLTLVGETVDPPFEIIGATVARRRHYTRISVWTIDRENDAAVLQVGQRIKELVSVPKLEYQDHGASFESYRHVLV